MTMCTSRNRGGIVAIRATAVLASGCLGAATTMKGEIRDDSIGLASDHAGSAVRLQLHNAGTTPCEFTAVVTTLPPDALPVKDAQVVIDSSGAPNTVQMLMGGPAGSLKRVMPGEDYEIELALEGAPRTGERIMLCNGVGDYARGRYTVLRFDR
jgi:hypothetical protein